MSGTHPLVEVRDAARWFDVSPPWLERKLSGKPKVMLRAVDGVSFDIARGERRWRWWASRAAASPPWRACWSGCTA